MSFGESQNTLKEPIQVSDLLNIIDLPSSEKGGA